MEHNEQRMYEFTTVRGAPYSHCLVPLFYTLSPDAVTWNVMVTICPKMKCWIFASDIGYRWCLLCVARGDTPVNKTLYLKSASIYKVHSPIEFPLRSVHLSTRVTAYHQSNPLAAALVLAQEHETISVLTGPPRSPTATTSLAANQSCLYSVVKG